MYKIREDEFELDSGGIVGILDDEEGLFWAIDAYAKGKFISEHDYIEPKLSFTKLPHKKNEDPSFNTIHFPLAEAYDKEIDDWIGDFYIYDGHFFKSEITLTQLSASKFNFHCKGDVDISYETLPGDEFIPFEINIELPFYGILCSDTGEKKSRELLKDVCDTSNFYWIDQGNDYFDSAFLSTINFQKNKKQYFTPAPGLSFILKNINFIFYYILNVILTISVAAAYQSVKVFVFGIYDSKFGDIGTVYLAIYISGLCSITASIASTISIARLYKTASKPMSKKELFFQPLLNGLILGMTYMLVIFYAPLFIYIKDWLQYIIHFLIIGSLLGSMSFYISKKIWRDHT